MEYLLEKFRRKNKKKEVTLEELQGVLERTQPPPRKLRLSTGDYSEIYPKIYVGDW